MSDVQARPDELSSFDSTETTAANQLETDRDTLDNAFIAFRNAPGGGCAAQGDAIVGQAMTSLIAELREIPDWVKLVHDALLAADHTTRQRSRLGQRRRLRLGAAGRSPPNATSTSPIWPRPTRSP